MSKIFVVHFEDGFDVTDNLSRIKCVVEQSSDVKIRTLNDSWQAYCFACLHHAKKKLSHFPFVAVSLQSFRYKCFKCDTSGDVINFYAAERYLSNIEAIAQVSTLYGLEVPKKKFKNRCSQTIK